MPVSTLAEAIKYCLPPNEVAAFLRAVPAVSALRVRGLLTSALFYADAEQVRQCFMCLLGMCDELRQDASGSAWMNSQWASG